MPYHVCSRLNVLGVLILLFACISGCARNEPVASETNWFPDTFVGDGFSVYVDRDGAWKASVGATRDISLDGAERDSLRKSIDSVVFAPGGKETERALQFFNRLHSLQVALSDLPTALVREIGEPSQELNSEIISLMQRLAKDGEVIVEYQKTTARITMRVSIDESTRQMLESKVAGTQP